MNIKELQVLKGVYNRYSMRRIATLIGNTHSIVQDICQKLEEDGYINNPYIKGGPRLAVARTLTEKGIKALRDEHLLPKV
jgi:DNA-binding MarR family transcriptional regulator